MLHLTDLQDGDLQFVAENMRAADVAELEAAGGRAPLHALSDAVQVSVWRGVLRLRDQPLCIYGLREDPNDSTVGIPWMLGTDVIAQHPKEFMRYSRQVVEAMNDHRALLINLVDSRNLVSIAYLRRLGFVVDTHNPVTLSSGVPFYIFTRHV